MGSGGTTWPIYCWICTVATACSLSRAAGTCWFFSLLKSSWIVLFTFLLFVSWRSKLQHLLYIFMPPWQEAARGIMFTCCPSIHPSHSGERDMTGLPRGNFWRNEECPLGLKDEVIRVRWSKFTVRSSSLWPHVHPILVKVIQQCCLEGISSHLAQTFTWTRGWTE